MQVRGPEFRSPEPTQGWTPKGMSITLLLSQESPPNLRASQTCVHDKRICPKQDRKWRPTPEVIFWPAHTCTCHGTYVTTLTHTEQGHHSQIGLWEGFQRFYLLSVYLSFERDYIPKAPTSCEMNSALYLVERTVTQPAWHPHQFLNSFLAGPTCLLSDRIYYPDCTDLLLRVGKTGLSIPRKPGMTGPAHSSLKTEKGHPFSI